MNTNSLFGVHEKLGKFEKTEEAANNALAAANKALEASDKAARATNDLTVTIGKVDTSYKEMDEKMVNRLKDFDSKLDKFGQKITDLENAAPFKAQLDLLQAKVSAVETKIDGLQQAIGAPVRTLRRVAEFRSLRAGDRVHEAPLPGFVFRVALPEGMEANLLEEVSASFPTATTQRLGSAVTIMTRFDEKARLLFVSIVGARDDAIQAILDSPDGMRVSITYVIRGS